MPSKPDSKLTPKKRARKPGQSLTPRERGTTKGHFLKAYAADQTVSEACDAAGISRTTFYEWLEKDPEFSILYHQAKERADDSLRAEIRRRGKEGWDEDVYQLGKYAGKVRKYSDVLLMFQAKARMPEYREKQQLDLTTAGQPLGNIADGIGEALRDPEVAQSALALLERIASRHRDPSGPGVGGK